MASVLHIPRFNQKHANAELRKKSGEWFWVRMPISMDSLSRKRLMQTQDGREAFAVYVHLAELSAKDEPRGYLADERGPFDTTDLSLRTAIPQEVVERSIRALESAKIAWVCWREWNGNEIPSELVHSNSNSNSISSSPEKKKSDRFDEFWEVYPRKTGKAEAKRRWSRLDCDVIADEVLAGLARCKASKDWKQREAKYLPYPATWLKAEGWHDEPDSGDSSAKTAANKAAWDSLSEKVQADLLGEVKALDPDTYHSRGSTETERAMRKLAREKGLI